ncbi:MAG TPA: hypothetical protein VK995_02315, partial [Oceanipulchritudo sp.]|nr:hypothetical protein [Oceanipulchritudo sp.]
TSAEGIAALVAHIQMLEIGDGVENALLVSLNNANASYQMGNEIAGDNKIHAFQNKVKAMRGGQLTDEQADYLIFLSNLLLANG